MVTVKTKEDYENVVNKYEGNTKKKIGGWIALIVVGSFLFTAGWTMFGFGIGFEIVALIVLGPIMGSIISIPLIILGVTFTTLNAVKRGVARKKVKRAKEAIDKFH